MVRYITYFISIYKGETKPHAFSWLLWGVMVGIAAFAQFALEGGPSAWALAFVGASCLGIGVLALFIGERNFTTTDWLALFAALSAIPVWHYTEDPFAALLSLITIDVLSYYPTYRKSYSQPDTEPPISYFVAGSRYLFVMAAVSSPSFQTLIYPFFLLFIDWAFAIFIVLRRYQLGLPLHEYAKR
ncbi:MAG: hypothetical protein WAX89_05020 [Alphaproteobacteria bacterium]